MTYLAILVLICTFVTGVISHRASRPIDTYPSCSAIAALGWGISIIAFTGVIVDIDPPSMSNSDRAVAAFVFACVVYPYRDRALQDTRNVSYTSSKRWLAYIDLLVSHLGAQIIYLFVGYFIAGMGDEILLLGIIGLTPAIGYWTLYRKHDYGARDYRRYEALFWGIKNAACASVIMLACYHVS